MCDDLKKEQRRLGRQIREINRSGIDDLKKALALLQGVAAPAIADLPTRQQRRKAERDAQKRGRS